MTRGVYAEPQETLLTSRALDYLSAGPADVVDLIGHICSLPGAPRIVAEHMARAMFDGRHEFTRIEDGRWTLTAHGSGSYVSPGESTRTDRQALSAQSTASGQEGLAGAAPARARARRDAIARGLTPYSRFSEPLGRPEPLSELSYAVVDVETTGGGAYRGDRITEIAAVVVKGGEIVEVFETLVNPERPIPPFITQLTNITWDMVRDAPTFERVVPEVLRVLEGNVFVAHNAVFDWRFVTAEISRCVGQRLYGRRVCTVRVARKILPQLSRRSLDNVARYYGVEIKGRHRAGGDAIATAKCFIRMLSDLEDRGYGTWEELDVLLRKPAMRRKKRRASGLPTPVTNDTTA
ncbi:MAG: 3'-5' exonuclease [Gemmatimonadaceae bacterium]